jgi:hypothetical protein
MLCLRETALIVLLCLLGGGQQGSKLPSGPNPDRFVLARIDGDQVVFKSIGEMTITAEIAGKPPASKHVVTSFETKRQVKDLRAFDMTGKELDKGAAAKALKEEKLVVLSFGGAVDPQYAALFKAETLNLVLPKDKAWPPGGPVIDIPSDKQ